MIQLWLRELDVTISHKYKCTHCSSVYVFVCLLMCTLFVYVVVFCRDARVVKDMATGKSKGYGFVSFFNKWVCSVAHGFSHLNGVLSVCPSS